MGRNLLISVMLGSLLTGAIFSGCTASTPQSGSIYTRLQADDPDVRIQAIIQAGNDKDRAAVPLLVTRLDDNDPEVRMFAGMALQKILGDQIYEANGWKFYKGPVQRQEGIDNWKKWIAANMTSGKAPGMWTDVDAKIAPATQPVSGTK